MKKKGFMISMALKAIIGLVIAAFFVFFLWSLLQGAIVYSACDADVSTVNRMANDMKALCKTIGKASEYAPGKGTRVDQNYSLSQEMKDLKFIKNKGKAMIQGICGHGQKFNVSIEPCTNWSVFKGESFDIDGGKKRITGGLYKFEMRAELKEEKWKVMDMNLRLKEGYKDED